MTEEDELTQIRKKKLEELMKRQKDIQNPRPPTVIEVFTSPTCPHCPQALMMAKQVATQVTGIQVAELSTATPQGMAKAALYGIQAVPAIYINGKKAFLGAPPSIEALRNAIKK
jgi:small redox-active disulfide protein 1